jgi:hypothetical protein
MGRGKCRAFVTTRLADALSAQVAVVLDNFISSAQSEGLLKTSHFTDVLQKIIAMRVFVRMMRLKIETLKLVEELQVEEAGRRGAGRDMQTSTPATELCSGCRV